MPFTISEIKAHNLNLLQLADPATRTRVRILTDHGAVLQEFSSLLNRKRVQAVAGYRNLTDFRRNHMIFYRGAKLSPFPCRIDRGRYAFEGKQYEFGRKWTDGSAIHGLLADRPFRIEARHADESCASVLLEHVYLHADPGYPFDYKINVKYTLKEERSLRLETTITNLSPVNIPMADGWHPYFSVGGRVDDWMLTVRTREMLTLNERLVPDGSRLPMNQFLLPRPIGSFVFDHCFLPEIRPGEPVCTLYNMSDRIRLIVFQDTAYPYLQIYSPEDRQSLAIESLSAAPDCFNNGLGLIVLAPGHSQSFTVEYQLGLL
jgi:aldose 1-epimerase